VSGFCKSNGLRHLHRHQNAVIATGGSVVYYESSMRSPQRRRLIVYLELPLPN
jgi:shikimate kinase